MNVELWMLPITDTFVSTSTLKGEGITRLLALALMLTCVRYSRRKFYNKEMEFDFTLA